MITGENKTGAGGLKAEARNHGAAGPPPHCTGVRLSCPAERQKWKDKVKAKGFTMWPLTQRRMNTVFICAGRNDGCYPGDR